MTEQSRSGCCSFCQTQREFVIRGPDGVTICPECIVVAYRALEEVGEVPEVAVHDCGTFTVAELKSAVSDKDAPDE